MKEYNDLKYELNDGVLIVWLNRPEKRNAMRLELREELIDCLLAAENDDAVRAIVVTGAGDKAFSAGADLNELQLRTTHSELSRGAEVRRRLPHVAETLSKPIIAAINGACIGAGLEFALGCAIRIASEKATFALPEIRIGVLPGSGGTQRLARVVGQGWALHMCLLGHPIDAQTAFRIGLVTQIVPPESLLTQAIAIAKELGEQPSFAYQATRDAVVRSFDVDLETGIDYERKLFALCLSTGEPQQRAAALHDRLSNRSRPSTAKDASTSVTS